MSAPSGVLAEIASMAAARGMRVGQLLVNATELGQGTLFYASDQELVDMCRAYCAGMGVDPSQQNAIQRRFDDGYKAVRQKFSALVHDSTATSTAKRGLWALVHDADECSLSSGDIVAARAAARALEKTSYSLSTTTFSSTAAAETLAAAVLYDSFATAFEPYARRTTPNVA